MLLLNLINIFFSIKQHFLVIWYTLSACIRISRSLLKYEPITIDLLNILNFWHVFFILRLRNMIHIIYSRLYIDSLELLDVIELVKLNKLCLTFFSKSAYLNYYFLNLNNIQCQLGRSTYRERGRYPFNIRTLSLIGFNQGNLLLSPTNKMPNQHFFGAYFVPILASINNNYYLNA